MRLAQVSKSKACRGCGDPFVPIRPLQVVCSPRCALRTVSKKAKTAERVKDRKRLDDMRPLSHWMKQAQAAFNAWVRARDIAAGHGCIDCGKPFELARVGGSVDAGHYLSRGSAPHLKFDERNVFAQRKNCNRPGGATRADFRFGVIARIGLAAVEALEADQRVNQYRREDLLAIRDRYRVALRELAKGRE